MHDALGAAGETVEYAEPVEARPVDQFASCRDLVVDGHAGRPVLLTPGGDPIYTSPVDLGIGEVVLRVALRASVGLGPFWFYSHAAVYVMGVTSEPVSAFARKRLFGCPAACRATPGIAASMFTAGMGLEYLGHAQEGLVDSTRATSRSASAGSGCGSRGPAAAGSRPSATPRSRSSASTGTGWT